MIEINEKVIKIYGKNNEELKIFFNSKLTLKERINALKVKSAEECENIILEKLWEMELNNFPLNIWKEIQPYVFSCKNFLIINKKSDTRKINFHVSKIYLNKIK